MNTIRFSSNYQKKAKKFFKKHSDLYARYVKIIGYLQTNIHHPSLRLHKLSGDLKNIYSISITMKYRITLELEIQDEKIILINIGSHNEVY